ncbi:MAG TPA: class I SAM-dependent methyltransferase [Lacunisphaera sp.]
MARLPYKGRMKTSDDPFVAMKARQREMWSAFSPTATFTTPVAGRLVRFAGIASGEKVLDVGTGTGVVAVTAARAGARVSAMDLSPVLLEDARHNAQIAGIEGIEWAEGDAEKLPYADASFDVVLSQFGHMFAPRPEVAISEIRRVLRPGGRVAFATWPPEHFVGRFFALVSRHSPPPPVGAMPPPLWGNPTIVAERLKPHFEAPFFERGTMLFPALSVNHLIAFYETTIGPLRALVGSLAKDDEKLRIIRQELAALATPYYVGNEIRQDYLFTRARVAA